MTPLALVMLVLSTVLLVYSIFLIVRIFLSWIQVDRSNPAINLLCRVTDPYLNFFRRFKWLTINRLDFSPVFAILVINFLMTITNKIRMYGTITLGISLAIIIDLLWAAIGFILGFFVILSLVRLVSLWFSFGTSPLWGILDSILQPLLARITTVFLKRIVRYQTGLLILALVFFVFWQAGNIGIGFLTNWVAQLPL